MAPLRGFVLWLFIFLQLSARVIEAVAAVSFQFLQSYSSVESSIEEFTSQLTEDIRTKYSFTSQHITSIQVSSSPSGRIQVNFGLDIDTSNSMLTSQRDRLENDLLVPNYIFIFMNSTGAREAFLVDGSSASVMLSFWDRWHQYGPDILYAILVGLVLIALFSAAVYGLVAKQKKWKKYKSEQDSRMAPSTGHLNGIDNEGYVTEMTQVYRIKNTEASPIPHHPSRSEETSFTVIVPSSTESTEPQSPNLLEIPQPSSPMHLGQSTELQSPNLQEIPQPSSAMHLGQPTEPQSISLDEIPQPSSPGLLQQTTVLQSPTLDEVPQPPSPTQSHQGEPPPPRRSITTSESPTLNTFMAPQSSSLVQNIISLYESKRPGPRSSISKQTPPSSSAQPSQQLDQPPLRTSVTPSPSSPQPSRQLDHLPVSVSLTPAVSPTTSEKPPTSPNLSQTLASSQGSVRSSILGVSTTTTPASSRRTSIIGPSIYARLLYASYSVPPKRIYSYI